MAGTAGDIGPAGDRVGIICPVYNFGLPAIVAGFAQRLNSAAASYCFAILTKGGIGGSSLHQPDFIVYAHSGRHLDAAFTISKPGNFVPLCAP